MMSSTERKYDDEGVNVLSSKDDFKQQQFEARNLTKERPVWTEQIATATAPAAQPDFLTGSTTKISGVKEENANAALAPIIEPATLLAEKSQLHHVSGIEEGEFGSFHLVKETEKIQTTAPTGGDPLPSQTELPSKIGESAGAGFEQIKNDIMERAAPQIEKAKEMYAMWKGEENRQVGESSSTVKSDSAPSESAMDKAKLVFNDLKDKAELVYNDSIAPQITKASTMINEQVENAKPKVQEAMGAFQRKTASAAPAPSPSANTPRKKREYTTRKPSATEDFGHRVIRYRNKAIEVFRGEEPLVKEYTNQGMRWIKQNKLEIPAIALSTLLLLWLATSLFGWMAFSKTAPANEQLVVFQPQTSGVNTHLHTTTDVSHDSASIVDSLKTKTAGLGDKITDQFDTIRDQVNDRVGHVSDSMPSMDELKMKATDRMHHMIPDVNMPSMPSMPSTDSIKDSVLGAKDTVLAAMPSVADLKESAVDGIEKIKAATNLNGDMKDDANAPPHRHTQPTTGMMADDINAPPHQHTQPQPIRAAGTGF